MTAEYNTGTGKCVRRKSRYKTTAVIVIRTLIVMMASIMTVSCWSHKRLETTVTVDSLSVTADSIHTTVTGHHAEKSGQQKHTVETWQREDTHTVYYSVPDSAGRQYILSGQTIRRESMNLLQSESDRYSAYTGTRTDSVSASAGTFSTRKSEKTKETIPAAVWSLSSVYVVLILVLVSSLAVWIISVRKRL